MASPPSSSPADPKRVVDWNHHLIGYLEPGTDPLTGAGASTLHVHLAPEAREELGTEAEDLALPFHLVASLRRDEVMLDRSSRALKSSGL